MLEMYFPFTNSFGDGPQSHPFPPSCTPVCSRSSCTTVPLGRNPLTASTLCPSSAASAARLAATLPAGGSGPPKKGGSVGTLRACLM